MQTETDHFADIVNHRLSPSNYQRMPAQPGPTDEEVAAEEEANERLAEMQAEETAEIAAEEAAEDVRAEEAAGQAENDREALAAWAESTDGVSSEDGERQNASQGHPERHSPG